VTFHFGSMSATFRRLRLIASSISGIPFSMSRLAKGIEISANLGILLASCFVVVFLYYNRTELLHWKSHVESIKVGDKLAINGYDWASHKKTYVLALQVGCQYCTASAPAFRQLTEAAAQYKDTAIIAVLPQSQNVSSKETLNKHPDFHRSAG